MSSSVFNSLHEILKDALGSFTLADDTLGLNSWDKGNANFLQFCIRNHILTQTELSALVKDRINVLGRASYEMHKEKRVPPDHVMSPHALAFAMRSGELSESEIQSITFDHGDTYRTFFEQIDSEFPHTVLQLLSASQGEVC